MKQKTTPPKKMTQVEFENEMHKLHEEQRQKSLSLHQMHTMKVQERKIVKKQIDDLYARSNALATEINSISEQIREINVDYGAKKQTLRDEYWRQFTPKEWKPLNHEMAYRIRYSVLNSLRDALKPHCRIDDIAFDFNFEEDGNVTFKTTIPEICKTQSETE